MTKNLYDGDVEESLLGYCIGNPAAFDEIADIVHAEDFYVLAHVALFDLMRDLRLHGHSIRIEALGAEVRRRSLPINPHDLVRMQHFSTANFHHAAELVSEYRAARNLRAAGQYIASLAEDMTIDASEKLDRSSAALLIDLPSTATQNLTNFYRLDEYLTRKAESVAPWIVPGLLRRGWRCIVVAEEGLGKSMMFRQIAMAASHGMHPFSHRQIPPARAMLVDLENPPDVNQKATERLNSWAIQRAEDYDGDRWAMWEEPGGIDLRSRRDQHQFEARVLDGKPDLVCLGPLYKCYQVGAKETDDLAAGEIMRFFDQMRTKYGFALLLEHHAPKAQGGKREILPYGTSKYARWPEIGIKMTPADDVRRGSVNISRWRRDRVEELWWPDRIDRGGPSEPPWTGYWTNPSRSAPIGALPGSEGPLIGREQTG